MVALMYPHMFGDNNYESSSLSQNGNEYNEAYEDHQNSTSLDVDQNKTMPYLYGQHCYDATWTLALALNRTVTGTHIHYTILMSRSSLPPIFDHFVLQYGKAWEVLVIIIHRSGHVGHSLGSKTAILFLVNTLASISWTEIARKGLKILCQPPPPPPPPQHFDYLTCI